MYLRRDYYPNEYSKNAAATTKVLFQTWANEGWKMAFSRQTLAAEPGVQCPSPHDKKREPAPESCPLTPNTHRGCHMHHHTPTNYQTKCKNGQRTQLDTSLPQ